jgi:hypothetical protein
MSDLSSISTAQLREAIQIRDQIEKLQTRLSRLLGTKAPATASKPASSKGPNKMSAATRAKIAAAAKARWARIKGGKAKLAATPAPKKKGGLTPAGRARLAAAMKVRWAARKKGAPALNAPQ